MKKIILILILAVLVSSCSQTQKNNLLEDQNEQKELPPAEEQKAASVVLTIPSDIENSCFGFLTGAPNEAGMISEIGMSWSRPHTGPFVWNDLEPNKGNFDFSETDLWVKEAQENNIVTLATIWPYADWDQGDCHGSECYISSQDQFSPLPKSRCAPCSLDDYQKFLIKLVERYDGDGTDDMFGLEIPIKYYEILNEPEMNEPTLTFYKGTPEEYIKILKTSNEAIKSACSDCRIVQGGAAGTMDFMLAYWQKIFSLGGGNYFDIANIHYVGSGDLSTLNVGEFKKLMNDNGISKPIWVTEAEYNHDGEVSGSVKGALDAGAEKIFFTRFVVGQTGPPMPGKYSPVYKEVECK